LAVAVSDDYSPGSCALMAVLDTAHRNLYVACTGDCRAVAGIWEKDADGGGSWRVEVLTEDQTGRNPNELKRYRTEQENFYRRKFTPVFFLGCSPNIPQTNQIL
jgi:pyruvate dehydrogenase phosphatase